MPGRGLGTSYRCPHCHAHAQDDFEPLKLIGKGAFGEVRICRDRSTGKLVAVKKLRKAEMVRRGQVSTPRFAGRVCSGVVALRSTGEASGWGTLAQQQLRRRARRAA